VFSHAQTVVVCAACSQVLCQPTGTLSHFAFASFRYCLDPFVDMVVLFFCKGGKARLTEGCSFRRKQD
jgi:small subunit ribosomal protein S27e